MTHYRLPLALGALMLCMAVLGAARAAEQSVVRFCFNEWPPYAATVDGQAVGLSVDILREAARRASKVPQFVSLPWKRCLQSVLDGDIQQFIDAYLREQARTSKQD